MEELNSKVLPPEQGEKPVLFTERYGISPTLFAGLSLFVVFVLYQILGGLITLLLFGFKTTAENVPGYRIVTGGSQIIFLLIPTLLLVRLSTASPSVFLRLKPPGIGALIAPLLGIFSLQQMLQIYLEFQDKFPLPEEMKSKIQEFRDMIEEVYRLLVSSNSVPELLWVIFLIALIPAVSEELLFRGLVQRNLENAMGRTRGVIITGIIFGLYHLNPFSFVPLAALGIYLGFLAVRSGSIWVSVMAHFANNLFASIALYLNLKEDYVVAGNAGEMSLMGLLATFWFFGVVFLLSTYYFLKVTATHPPAVKINGSPHE